MLAVKTCAPTAGACAFTTIDCDAAAAVAPAKVQLTTPPEPTPGSVHRTGSGNRVEGEAGSEIRLITTSWADPGRHWCW